MPAAGGTDESGDRRRIESDGVKSVGVIETRRVQVSVHVKLGCSMIIDPGDVVPGIIKNDRAGFNMVEQRAEITVSNDDIELVRRAGRAPISRLEDEQWISAGGAPFG